MQKKRDTQEENNTAQRKLEIFRLFVVLFVFSGMVVTVIAYLTMGNGYESAFLPLVISLFFGSVILWFFAKAMISRLHAAGRQARLYRLRSKMFWHDIGGRLTTIRYGIETSDVEGNESLDMAYLAAAKGIELVHQMKDLEKLEKSGDALHAVVLRPILESIAESYELPIVIEEDATVLADHMLKSTLENLIRNAEMHSDTEKLSIMITSKNGHVEVAVIDYGKGIPDEAREKLFTEGFSYGETGNSGLGLYIVKETMKHYGGSIRFMETQPSGATFVLQFQRGDEVTQ